VDTDREVTIYTKAGCPYCEAAKKDLSRRNIRFEEIDLDKRPEAKEKVVKLSGKRLVPVIIDGDGITAGFGGRG
jgi:glutaredoxin